MADDVKVKVAKKLSAAEEKNIDPAKVGHTHATKPPQKGQVEAQEFRNYVICWHCGAGNWIWEIAPGVGSYRCWNCGVMFTPGW